MKRRDADQLGPHPADWYMADETVTVRRDSLATILKLAEEGLLTRDDVTDLDLTELRAALTNLHTAMASHGNDRNGDTK